MALRAGTGRLGVLVKSLESFLESLLEGEVGVFSVRWWASSSVMLVDDDEALLARLLALLWLRVLGRERRELVRGAGRRNMLGWMGMDGLVMSECV